MASSPSTTPPAATCGQRTQVRLADPDPCTWRGVTCTTGTVTELSLTDNRLSGTIASELGNLTNLTRLDLGNNQLTGTIPSELGNLTNLTWLSLSDNQLSGAIPSELGNLTDLTYLRLRGQTGCLTAADAALAVWLAGFDLLWNDGCP